jgi:hypothetical protein
METTIKNIKEAIKNTKSEATKIMLRKKLKERTSYKQYRPRHKREKGYN